MRIGSAAMACRRTPRWVCARWRKSVTQTLVKCPAITTKSTGIHHRDAHAPNSGIAHSTDSENTNSRTALHGTNANRLDGDKWLRSPHRGNIRSRIDMYAQSINVTADDPHNHPA